jgi:neutral trehalase
MGGTGMRLSKSANKKMTMNSWDHRAHEREAKNNDYLLPELEAELLDYGFVLKHRVSRNMKKVRRDHTRYAH